MPFRKLRINPDHPDGEAAPFLIVGPNSPQSYRMAVRLLAEDFANMEHCSPAPYEVNEAENNPEYSRDRVLLFSNPTSGGKIKCYGAAGLRWQEYEDLPEPGWIMTWAWMHPNQQRKGHLRRAWPHICRLFPNFRPLPPLSDAMQAFLKAVGP